MTKLLYGKEGLAERLGGVYAWCICKAGMYEGCGLAYWRRWAYIDGATQAFPRPFRVRRLMDRGRHWDRKG